VKRVAEYSFYSINLKGVGKINMVAAPVADGISDTK
jgi:hypothetical protein